MAVSVSNVATKSSGTSSSVATKSSTEESLALTITNSNPAPSSVITVNVDGKLVFKGTIKSASKTISLGKVGAASSHSVSVSLQNAKDKGTPAITVSSVSVDGKSVLQTPVKVQAGKSQGFSINGHTVVPSSPATSAGSGSLATNPKPSSPAPAPVVLGSGPDKAAIFLTENAVGGNAEFEVLVNGAVVGGVQTATVHSGSGQEQEVDILGNFSTAGAAISVRLLNAEPGSTSASTRDVSIDKVTLNGINTGTQGVLTTNSALTTYLGSPASVAQGSGNDTLTLHLSGVPVGGSPMAIIDVDGTQIAEPISVQANSLLGATELVTVDGNFGTGVHTVSVYLANGANAGQSLTVSGATLDGASIFGLSGTTGSGTSLSGSVTVASAPTAPVVDTTPGAKGAVGLEAVTTPTIAAGTQVLTVGVGEEYSTIAAAVSAAGTGAVILVNAGTYTNDFIDTTSKVTLVAVGGRVNMVATEPPPNYKGIITAETDLTVEGFNFSGSSIPDSEGGNGAGIRVDAGNLTLINDEFNNNENGILVNPGAGDVTIDHSVFNDNGSGSGYTHNLYVGDVPELTVTNSIFENVQIGNEFKSRAEANTITNNEFIDGEGIGDGSYNIDLPNGGDDIVSNNTLIKGANAQNDAMLHFGGEGIPYTGSSLTATNNVFEADNNSAALPILNQTAISVVGSGNEFANITGPLVNGPATLTNSTDGNGNALANVSATSVLPSGALVFTDNQAHSVTLLNENYTAVEGGAGHLTVDAEDGHITAIGGTGGMTLKESTTGGGNSITTAIGSTNSLTLNGAGDTIDSQGFDTITANAGNDTGVANGVATINTGTGNSSWTVNGRATFNTTAGSNFIGQALGSTVTVDGTAGYFADSDSGGLLTWNMTGSGNQSSGSGTGSFSIAEYSGSANITTAGGSAGGVFQLGAGDAQIESHGPDLIYAGSGAGDVIFNGSGGTVYAGTGQLSVFAHGGGGGASVYGANGDITIGGDSGGINYFGSNQSNTVEAALSGITLTGGTGHMTINGGSRDTIVGGLGGITFNNASGGANTITTAANSSNTVITANSTIHSYGTDTLSEAGGQGSIDVHGNSTVKLSDGNYAVSLAGTDTVTTTGGGHNITVATGAKATVNASNLDSITDNGGTLSLNFTDAGASNAVTSLTASGQAVVSAQTWSGAFQASTDGSAAETVSMSGNGSLTSNGADKIHTGSGTETVTVNGHGQAITAGSGALTVNDWSWASGNTFSLTGGSGTIAVNAGGSSQVNYVGGSGAATLSGDNDNGCTYNITGGSGAIKVTGANIGTFTGGSGTANISLDASGSAHFVFGTGSTTVSEASYGPGDLYEFAKGASGTEVINGFKVGTDTVKLDSGVTVKSSSVSSVGALFNLSNGAHVTFAGLASTHGIFS